MVEYPAAVRTAQVIGLTGTAYLAGNISSFTLASVPALQTAHTSYAAPITLIVQQWRDMYDAGHAQNPPIALASASAFAYLAYSVHRSAAIAAQAPRNAVALYAAAAALTVGIVPWTLAMMLKTNKVLLDRAGGDWVPDEQSSEEVKGALGRWRVLNGIRGVLPLVGAVVGFLAV